MNDVAALIIIIAFFVAALLGIVFLARVKRVVIFEYERGVLYRLGRFQRVLEPGQYWIVRGWHALSKVDTRASFVSIPGQEVLSADNVTVKISLAANYKVEDPRRALNEATNYQVALYLGLQLILRDLVASLPVDDLLVKRREINDLLLEAARPRAAELGLSLLSVGVKDVMFPGELKNIFAQVVNARKEGLAALERARGESAALRNLANTARLLENNPALLQLRLLQALSASSGNTLVLKLNHEGDDEPLAGARVNGPADRPQPPAP